MRTLRATIDKEGKVELLEPITLNAKRQVLVTILGNELLKEVNTCELYEGRFSVLDDFDGLT